MCFVVVGSWSVGFLFVSFFAIVLFFLNVFQVETKSRVNAIYYSWLLEPLLEHLGCYMYIKLHAIFLFLDNATLNSPKDKYKIQFFPHLISCASVCLIFHAQPVSFQHEEILPKQEQGKSCSYFYFYFFLLMKIGRYILIQVILSWIGLSLQA